MKVAQEYELVKNQILELGKDRIWSVGELVSKIKRPSILERIYDEVVLGDKHYHIQSAVMTEHSPIRLLEKGIQNESPVVQDAAKAELVRRFKREFRIS